MVRLIATHSISENMEVPEKLRGFGIGWPFALGLAIVVSIGCTREAPKTQQIVPSKGKPASHSEGHGLEDDPTVVLSGVQGQMLLSEGTVLNPDGTPCADALVTLNQDFSGSPRRTLFTRSNAEGRFEVRGDVRSNSANAIWAVNDLGQLGVVWNRDSAMPITIQLRGESIAVHIWSRDCKPIANAKVTVYKCSIDTISLLVPPNIREKLQKTSDGNGLVEFPVAFSYGDDIGLHVCAPGRVPMMRGGYSTTLTNLFVVSKSRQIIANCVDVFRAELSADPIDRRQINLGHADRRFDRSLP